MLSKLPTVPTTVPTTEPSSVSPLSPSVSPPESPSAPPPELSPKPQSLSPEPPSLLSLAARNARRTRRENLIYFFTLIAAIASFYIICALPQQDAIVYLREFESDAVNRLLALMPLEYAFALFLLFFLVLFANRYQITRRNREFGIHLMLGMSKRKLFVMLAIEGLISCIVALLVGLAIGIICGELISLICSRLLGQGIISHQLSFSGQATIWTVTGFIGIQTLSLLVMSLRLAKQEPGTLLSGQTAKKQRKPTPAPSALTLVIGLGMLVAAFLLAPRETGLLELGIAAITLILLLAGTIITIRGATRLLSLLARATTARRSKAGTAGLAIFNIRQIQEAIVGRSAAVAVVSFLSTLALVFLSAGCAIIANNGASSARSQNVYDFTVIAAPVPDEQFMITDANGASYYDPTHWLEQRDTEDQRIAETLATPQFKPYLANLNPLRIGTMNVQRDPQSAKPLPESLDWSALRERMLAQLATKGITPSLGEGGSYSLSANAAPEDILYTMLGAGMNSPELIRISDYNRLLEAAGENTVALTSSQLACYMHPQVLAQLGASEAAAREFVNGQLGVDGAGSGIKLGGRSLSFVACPPSKNLVCDRSITIRFALIVPDELFEQLTTPLGTTTYWNFCIPAQTAENLGLMQAIRNCASLLEPTGFAYENYLINFGRTLFYQVAASYTFIYLGALFLLIALTLLALQFLTQAKTTLRRYLTLQRLGTTRQQIHTSVRTQTCWYFLLPQALACASAAILMQSTMSALLRDLAAQENAGIITAVLFALVILLITAYATATIKVTTKAIDQMDL